MNTAAEGPIPGATIHQDTVVPAREPWSARIEAGDRLRLVAGGAPPSVRALVCTPGRGVGPT
jgi:hypothetical protein